MSDSQRALDITHAALSAMHGNGAKPHASVEILARLAATLTPKSAGSQPRAAASVLAPTRSAPLPAMPVFTAQRSAAPTAGTKSERLAAMRGPVLACALCPALVQSRSQVVFGTGSVEAELMFVGDAPGADDDLVGEPFCGEAGRMLTKIIETMGMRRSEVYIATVLKCHTGTPPGATENRKPTTAEMQTCKPYLLEQIRILQPRVIVALGGVALEALLGIEKAAIARERGNWRELLGIPLMPTFHPGYFQHTPTLARKRELWEDMLAVMEKLGRPISAKQEGYFLPKG